MSGPHTCADYGFDIIKNKDDCTTGVTATIGSWRTGFVQDIDSDKTTGCTYDTYNGQVWYNSRESESLCNQNGVGSPQQDYKGCVCTTTLPTCPNGDGTVANMCACACGNTACTAETGLFCDASNNKCASG